MYLPSHAEASKESDKNSACMERLRRHRQISYIGEQAVNIFGIYFILSVTCSVEFLKLT
jgi:hypothetical protein